MATAARALEEWYDDALNGDNVVWAQPGAAAEGLAIEHAEHEPR
jgi:hypothetical protein